MFAGAPLNTKKEQKEKKKEKEGKGKETGKDSHFYIAVTELIILASFRAYDLTRGHSHPIQTSCIIMTKNSVY